MAQKILNKKKKKKNPWRRESKFRTQGKANEEDFINTKFYFSNNH